MMKFNSKAGQEVRTWILFFVGIAIALIFAITKTPLNPWWTLVIGAFTCTAIIVSAVQALAGGMTDAARRALREAQEQDDEGRRGGSGGTPQEPPKASFSIAMGARRIGAICGIRRNHPVAIQ